MSGHDEDEGFKIVNSKILFTVISCKQNKITMLPIIKEIIRTIICPFTHKNTYLFSLHLQNSVLWIFGVVQDWKW